jgi:O-antigen/teichoic acid export membrane protein
MGSPREPTPETEIANPPTAPLPGSSNHNGRNRIDVFGDFGAMSVPGDTPDMPTVILSAVPRRQNAAVWGEARPAGRRGDPVTAWIQPVIDAETMHLPATTGAAVKATGSSYLGLLRNLLSSSGVYALAALGPPLVSLVLSPFLAHHLSIVDFGIMTILNTVVTLVTGLTQLGLGSSFFRAYNYDYEEKRDRFHALSTTVLILAFASGLCLLLGLAFAHQISSVLLQSAKYAQLIALTFGVILLQNLSVPGFSWARAENKAMIYGVLSTLNTLVTLGGTIYLVGNLQMGVAGSLLAKALGYAVIDVLSIPVIVIVVGVRIRLDIAWDLISFGVPLSLSTIAFWVLQLADRYLLSRLGSLPAVASYAVAYTLGTVISTVVITPFTLAWPSTFFTIAKRADAPQILALFFRWFGYFLLFMGYLLTLVGIALLRVLFPPSYQTATPVIAIVSLSIVFFGTYTIFMSGANIVRKTWLGTIFITIAAALNVGINFILIPLKGPFGGAMGAAIATLAAYIAMSLMAYGGNQRLYFIPFELGRFLFAALLGGMLYAGSEVATTMIGPNWYWPFHVLGFVLYAIYLAFNLARGVNFSSVKSLLQRQQG